MTVASSRSPVDAHGATGDGRGDDRTCLNCGAAAPLRYCPTCGQSTTLHPPTVREFAHEFLGHYVAFEGPLWRTLVALVVRPGRLTVDYFAGRRARYIPPLRLYLTFSLILFALTSLDGGSLRIADAIQVRNADDMTQAPLVIGFDRTDAAPTGFAPVDALFERIGRMTPAERAERVGASVRQLLPYVLILLVPVLALYLRVLYRNRRRLYGEHLVVAFHAQTVVFLFASALALVPQGPWSAWLAAALAMLLLAQAFLALRRVYGGRVVMTAVREIVLFVGYGITVSLAVAVLTILALGR